MSEKLSKTNKKKTLHRVNHRKSSEKFTKNKCLFVQKQWILLLGQYLCVHENF